MARNGGAGWRWMLALGIGTAALGAALVALTRRREAAEELDACSDYQAPRPVRARPQQTLH